MAWDSTSIDFYRSTPLHKPCIGPMNTVSLARLSQGWYAPKYGVNISLDSKICFFPLSRLGLEPSGAMSWASDTTNLTPPNTKWYAINVHEKSY